MRFELKAGTKPSPLWGGWPCAARSGGGREAAADFTQAKTLLTKTAGVNISPVPERDFSTVPSGDSGAFRLSPINVFNKRFELVVA